MKTSKTSLCIGIVGARLLQNISNMYTNFTARSEANTF